MLLYLVQQRERETVKEKLKPISIILGDLQCPWRRVKHDHKLEIIFVMARIDYKIAAHVGCTRHATTLIIVLKSTGPGSSSVTHSLIPYELQNTLIHPSLKLA